MIKDWNTPSSSRDLVFGEGSKIGAVGRLLQNEAERLADHHLALATSLSNQTVASLRAIKKEIVKKLEGLEREQKERTWTRKKDRDSIVKAKEHLQKVTKKLFWFSSRTKTIYSSLFYSPANLVLIRLDMATRGWRITKSSASLL